MIEKDLSFQKGFTKFIKIIKSKCFAKRCLNLTTIFSTERKVILVGNLPFNISTQLLFKWLETESWPPFYDKLILMFQKEVAERIISKLNCKKYGKIL